MLSCSHCFTPHLQLQAGDSPKETLHLCFKWFLINLFHSILSNFFKAHQSIFAFSIQPSILHDPPHLPLRQHAPLNISLQFPALLLKQPTLLDLWFEEISIPGYFILNLGEELFFLISHDFPNSCKLKLYQVNVLSPLFSKHVQLVGIQLGKLVQSLNAFPNFILLLS